MTVSEVSICNQALLAIGAQAQISQLSPSDGSAEGDACAVLFAPVRDMLLRTAYWNFCRAQAVLTVVRQAIINGQPSNDPPPQPWMVEYALPADSLRARFILPYIVPSSVGIPIMTGPLFMSPTMSGQNLSYFTLATDKDSNGNDINVLLTNLPQAQLVYTRLIDNPQLWDSNFVQALVSTLAAYLVNPLGRNAKLYDDMGKAAQAMVLQARLTSGNEGTQVQDHIPDWFVARYAGSGYGWVPAQGWYTYPYDTFACGAWSC